MFLSLHWCDRFHGPAQEDHCHLGVLLPQGFFFSNNARIQDSHCIAELCTVAKQSILSVEITEKKITEMEMTLLQLFI